MTTTKVWFHRATFPTGQIHETPKRPVSESKHDRCFAGMTQHLMSRRYPGIKIEHVVQEIDENGVVKLLREDDFQNKYAYGVPEWRKNRVERFICNKHGLSTILIRDIDLYIHADEDSECR